MADESLGAEQRFAGQPLPPPPAPPLPPPPPTRLQDHKPPSKRLPPHPTDETSSNGRAGRAGRAAMAAKFAAADRGNALRPEIPEPDNSFKPCHIFFYGSLMSSKVLQTVAKLDETPTTAKGIVRGLKIKLWGIYPAAIPSSDMGDTVAGTVWHIDDASQLQLLQDYEL